MIKKIYIIIFLYSLTLLTVNAETYIEKPCSTFGISTNASDQCFNGGYVYEGRGKTVTDTFNNNGNNTNVYFDDENIYFNGGNTTVYETSILQSTTNWFTSNNLIKYPDTFVWYTSATGRKYHIFEANKSELFLKTRLNGGFRLDNVNVGTDRTKPAYSVKFTSNYHVYNGGIGPKITHKEYVFYYPAWCGDGITDTSYGEQCDGGANCDTTCKIIPVNPVCGTRNNKIYPYTTATWPVGTTFCGVGTASPVSPVFPSQGLTTNWTCNNDGISVNCNANRGVSVYGTTPNYGDSLGNNFNQSGNVGVGGSTGF